MVYSIIQKSQLEGAKRLDAEYYQPEYLVLEEKLKKVNLSKQWSDLEGRFVSGPFGSEFNVENYVSDPKFRYIRGKDVKDFSISNEDNVYLSEKDYTRLKKYSLREGDILISVVGTFGNSAVVSGSILPAIFSCKSTIFRSKAINPYYFIAYLNSIYGKKLLERSVRGAVQVGLNLSDLRPLPIFIASNRHQNIIGSLVLEAEQTYKEAEKIYLQAENLFLEELKIDNASVDDKVGFVANLSDIKENNRCDAEYFQPKYKKVVEHIKKNCGGVAMGELVTIKKGIEPGAEEYLAPFDAEAVDDEKGKQFIRVSSLSKFGINDNDQKYLSEELYQKLKDNFEPKKGEILLTKDASPGIAYVLKEDIKGIISGGILRLKLRNKEVEDEYLALCINSIVGQMQVERDAGGSVIAHWRPEQVKNILIPILRKSIQQKISELIRQSHALRKKAKELLEEAKRKVEELIEKGDE